MNRTVVHFDEPPRPKGWDGLIDLAARRGPRAIPNPRRLDDGAAGGVCGPPCWGMLVYVVALAVLEGR